jgi:hypothetical protein
MLKESQQGTKGKNGEHKHHKNHVREEEIMRVMNANRHKLSKDVRHYLKSIISIGATCIAEIEGQFFLLVEIEIEIAGQEIEQVIVIRISSAQADILLRAGIERCTIVTTIPTPTQGVEVNLICVFVVGNFAFLVFDVENTTDRLVLVRVPLCTVI